MQFLTYRNFPHLFSFPGVCWEGSVYTICSKYPALPKTEKHPCILFSKLSNWLISIFSGFGSHNDCLPNYIKFKFYTISKQTDNLLLSNVLMADLLEKSVVLNGETQNSLHTSLLPPGSPASVKLVKIGFFFRDLLPFVLFSWNYPAGQNQRRNTDLCESLLMSLVLNTLGCVNSCGGQFQISLWYRNTTSATDFSQEKNLKLLVEL